MRTKRVTPTQQLKTEIISLKKNINELSHRNELLLHENYLLKEFFDLHFKQGVTSLVKALRVVTEALSKKSL